MKTSNTTPSEGYLIAVLAVKSITPLLHSTQWTVFGDLYGAGIIIQLLFEATYYACGPAP